MNYFSSCVCSFSIPLSTNALHFQSSSLLHDHRILRLAGRGSWNDRFKRTLRLHYDAQRTAILCASDGHIPTMDSYLAVRREMFGTSIMFDLAELLEVFPYPEFLHGTQRERLEQIRKCAFNIISWSIVSPSFSQAVILCSLVSRTSHRITSPRLPITSIYSQFLRRTITSLFREQ